VGLAGFCCCSTPCSPPNNLCVTIKECSGDLSVGLPVYVTGPEGFSASGTTDANGRYCVAWTIRGTYSVSFGGGYSTSFNVNLNLCQNYSFNFCLGNGQVCVLTGAGCNGQQLDGVTVTLKQGGTIVASGTPDSTGKFCACVPPNTSTTVSVTTSTPRFVDPAPYTFTSPATCTSTTVNMGFGMVDGYHCLCCMTGGACAAICRQPVKDQLWLSDSFLGLSGISMSYVGNVHGSSWESGPISYSYPGCTTACPAKSCTLWYYFGSTQNQVGTWRCGMTIVHTTNASVVGTACPGSDGGTTVVGRVSDFGYTIVSCDPFTAQVIVTKDIFSTLYSSGSCFNQQESTILITE